jgi:hypothetical protein
MGKNAIELQNCKRLINSPKTVVANNIFVPNSIIDERPIPNTLI